MELRAYLSLIRRWLWLSLLCLCLAALAAYVLSQQSPKLYRATAILLISQSNQVINNPNTELLASERLARTYTERLASPPVMEETIRRLSLPEESLNDEDINVQFIDATQLIWLEVEHENPEVAQAVANMIPEVFSERNQQQQSARYTEAKSNLEAELEFIQAEIVSTQLDLKTTREATRHASREAAIVQLSEQLTQLRDTQATLYRSYEQVRLLELNNQETIIIDAPAALPEEPVRPRPLLMTLVAAIIGAIIGLGAGFLIELMDHTIKPATDFQRLFGQEPLAMIARIEEKSQQMLITLLRPHAVATETYRMLRSNIRFASVDKTLQTLVITSPRPKEGKSTTAANLAVVIAQTGQEVILLDADLRRPVQHTIFEISNQVGLTTALVERESDVGQYLQETSIAGLRLLPSGPIPPNPADLLASQRMKELLNELQKQADLVIIDSSPILAVTDSSLLASSANSVLLILRANKTKVEDAQRSLRQLIGAEANILGLVLVDVQSGREGYYYDDYYYAGADLSATQSKHQPRFASVVAILRKFLR